MYHLIIYIKLKEIFKQGQTKYMTKSMIIISSDLIWKYILIYKLFFEIII